MHILVQNQALNMETFSFSAFNQEGHFYAGQGGAESQAAFAVDDSNITGALNGFDFQFQNPDDEFMPTAGTVTGVVVGDFTQPADSQAYLSVNGLSLDGKTEGVSIPDLFQIIQSSKPSDDQKLLKTSLSGDDKIQGAQFGDVLKGFAGDDKIKGGKGADVIIGGKGEDKLSAGKDSDKDVFVFNKGDSSKHSSDADHVNQFHTHEDKIDLQALGVHAKDVDLSYDKGGDTFIAIDYKGSGKADMEIVVNGNHHLHMADLVL